MYRVDISEILLFLLSSEDGTGIFVAWHRCRFFVFLMQYLSVVGLLSFAEA